MAGYYYGQLSKEKKAVYDMLAAGCDALAAVIRVPDLGRRCCRTSICG